MGVEWVKHIPIQLLDKVGGDAMYTAYELHIGHALQHPLLGPGFGTLPSFVVLGPSCYHNKLSLDNKHHAPIVRQKRCTASCGVCQQTALQIPEVLAGGRRSGWLQSEVDRGSDNIQNKRLF
jgi:predicted DNA-binding transcriptional regulator AlpA